MAFKPSDLSVLSYANNFTLWHYTTIDGADAVEGESYFDKGADMMRVKDLIIMNIDTDGTPVTAFYVVTGNDGTHVTVAAYA